MRPDKLKETEVTWLLIQHTSKLAVDDDQQSRQTKPPTANKIRQCWQVTTSRHNLQTKSRRYTPNCNGRFGQIIRRQSADELSFQPITTAEVVVYGCWEEHLASNARLKVVHFVFIESATWRHWTELCGTLQSTWNVDDWVPLFPFCHCTASPSIPNLECRVESSSEWSIVWKEFLR